MKKQNGVIIGKLMNVVLFVCYSVFITVSNKGQYSQLFCIRIGRITDSGVSISGSGAYSAAK